MPLRRRRPEMRRLFVLYDSDCGLCRQLAAWLSMQPAFVQVGPIPARSPWVARLFPSLVSSGAPRELVVVNDSGEVWLGDHAWIMCLYALRHYRSWARKLAHPLLLPLARHAFAALSKHRAAISSF